MNRASGAEADWIPRCLATAPRRMRNSSTSPATGPASGLPTRCVRGSMPQTLRAPGLGPVGRVGGRRLGKRPEPVFPDPQHQPRQSQPDPGTGAPDARRASRSSAARGPRHRSIGPLTAGCPRHAPTPGWDAPRASHRPEYPENRESSEGWRTSGGRFPSACRSQPSAGPGHRGDLGPQPVPKLDPARATVQDRVALDAPLSPARPGPDTRKPPRSNQRGP
jgi:hypothetical protein